MSHVREIAESAKCASRALAATSGEVRDRAIHAVADALEANCADLLDINRDEVLGAAAQLACGEMSQATLDRLKLTPGKIAEMSRSVRAVADLADPIGKVQERTELDTGLVLDRISCPLGVLAVIFEARPDAVTQISALALKSANAVILKAGKEVERTAAALVEIIREAIQSCGIPADAVALVVGREAVHDLLAMNELVDLVIPRGSKQLVQFVQSATKIPVLGHAEGICHVYVDSAADHEMALNIVDDAKTDYPAACNAAETVLVHQDIAAEFLPRMADRLHSRGVRLRGCDKSRSILSDREIEPVSDSEWQHEYGDLTLAVKVVAAVDDAIQHIQLYGSSHTETIVTEDAATAERFLNEVDSAGIFHNASTRFADGFRYGFGAEVGISTSKLHARGPVGLAGLTTYKYVLRGHGQVVREYHGATARPFTHRPLPVK